MIWLSGLNRTVTLTHKTAPWLRSLARQFFLAGLFYLFIKLAPAARPLSFLNVWPWRVARERWHRIRQLRRAAARRLRRLLRIYCAGNGPKLIAALQLIGSVQLINCTGWRDPRTVFCGRGPGLSGQIAQFLRQLARISRRAQGFAPRVQGPCF